METTSPVPHALLRPRAWHSATLLPDGNVVIVGGVSATGQVVPEVEVFDPVTQTFGILPVTGLTPRAYHTATLLREGRVLLAGGLSDQGEVLGTAEVWEPQMHAVTPLAAGLETARASHSAVLLPDGTVLVEGGLGQGHTVLSSREVYDPAHARFTLADPAALPAQQAPDETPSLAAAVPDDGARDVPVNRPIVLHVSSPLRVETVTAETVTLSGPQGVVAAAVIPAEGGRLVFLTPQAPLLPGVTYTLALDGPVDSTGVMLPVTTLRFPPHLWPQHSAWSSIRSIPHVFRQRPPRRCLLRRLRQKQLRMMTIGCPRHTMDRDAGVWTCPTLPCGRCRPCRPLLG